MSEIRNLTRNGETFYPLTCTEGLVNRDGDIVGEINDIFDVSEYNAYGTPPTLAKYTSLSLALAAVPSSKQKGGMTIRYVQTSDNKYVQYRLMSNSWSSNVGDWQGVDDVPEKGSKNLIESGAVFDALTTIMSDTKAQYDQYSPYIRNVYLIPISNSGVTLLKTLENNNTKIKITYLGINSSAISSTSVFGLQFKIGDDNIAFYIKNVPNFSESRIFELGNVGYHSGGLETMFKCFVEFNEMADFTPMVLYNLPSTYIKVLSSTQLSFLASYYKLLKIDNSPSSYSSNVVAGNGIFGMTNTIFAPNKEQEDKYSPYIKNIFLVPTTSVKFNSLKQENVNLRYLGVRNTSIGGESSIFGILVGDADVVDCCGFYTTDVPDLSLGTIVELKNKSSNTNNWGDNLRCFVEFNKNIDFTTTTGNISIGLPSVIVKCFDNTLHSLVQTLYNLFDFKIDDTLVPYSNNTIQNSTVYNAMSTIIPPNKAQEDKYSPYIKNVFIIPTTSAKFDYLKTLKNNNTYIRLTYLGVRERALGGPSSIFGIQLFLGVDNVASFYTTEIPNLSLGTIVELPKTANATGEISSGYRVFVEFNPMIDFNTPSELIIISLPVIYVNNYNNTIYSLFSNIANLNQLKLRYIVVDKNGSGDFTTLTAATDYASDGAIIKVMPGIYDNEVIVGGKTKTLFIIGDDRDKCVIKNSYGNYANAVIHIASGLLRNLTVIQEATSASDVGAYAVHADMNPMYNSTLRIENCTLRNHLRNVGALGAGLRGGGVLTIQNSTLENVTGGRALYCHDNNGPEYNGLQILRIVDSIIKTVPTDNLYAITIQGQGKNGERTFEDSQYYLEFVRNRIVGGANFVNWYPDDVTITDDDFQGVMNLRLSSVSWGNSDSVFNAE